MATETTGLLSQEQTDQLKAAADAAGETAKAAADAAQKQVVDVSDKLVKGKYNLSVLGLLGGVLMILVNLKDVIQHVATLRLNKAVLDAYLITFGYLIAIVNSAETKANMNIAPKTRQTMLYYAKFLCATWGRGMLYFFVGTLAFSQLDLNGVIGGCYMMLLGIICIYIGRNTAKKLAKLRDNEKSLCLVKFKRLATHGNLDISAFTEFLESYDLDLGRGEIVAVFTMLDSDCDGLVSVEEFDTWWEACEKLEAPDEEPEPEATPADEKA